MSEKAQAKQVGPYQVVELKHPDAKTAVLSCRLSADLMRRVHEACDGEPYSISISALAHRGLELAIEELAAIRKTMVERQAQRIDVYAMQRVLCLAEAHKSDDDLERLRAAMAEIAQFIHHAFAEAATCSLDQLTQEQRR